jgi:uncharacterized coiled-coil protein SlyX
LAHEGSNINKSLLSLTNCINILSDDKKRSAGFVPYRNSKLTRILKDSLSSRRSPDGDQPILMVVCLSQNGVFLDETINSIKYAEKSKRIKPVEIKAPVFSGTQEEAYKRRIQELEREVAVLKLKNQMPVALSEAQKSHVSTEDLSQMERNHLAEIGPLSTKLVRLGEQLAQSRRKLKELDFRINSQDAKINELQTVIGSETVESKLIAHYKKLRAVADELEKLIQDKSAHFASEKAARQETERVVEELKTVFKRGVAAALVRVKSSKQEFDEMNHIIERLRAEIKRKDEQINEVTKAMKNLVKSSNPSFVFGSPYERSAKKQAPTENRNLSLEFDFYQSALPADLRDVENILQGRLNIDMSQLMRKLSNDFKPVLSERRENLNQSRKFVLADKKDSPGKKARLSEHFGEIDDFELIERQRQPPLRTSRSSDAQQLRQKDLDFDSKSSLKDGVSGGPILKTFASPIEGFAPSLISPRSHLLDESQTNPMSLVSSDHAFINEVDKF